MDLTNAFQTLHLLSNEGCTMYMFIHCGYFFEKVDLVKNMIDSKAHARDKNLENIC